MPLDTTYQLVIVRGAGFEPGSNNTPASSKSIDPAGAVLASILTNDSDNYRFSTTAGSTITLRTFTPGDGPGLFFNSLDPRH